MKRDQWEFPYPADMIMHAAQNKLRWHTARLEVWVRTQKVLEDKIQQEGIVIDRGAEPESMSYSNKHMGGPQIRIDDVLVHHHRQATNKITEHKNRVDSFKTWIEILGSQGKSAYPMRHDDWMFFFGHQEQDMDQEEQRAATAKAAPELRSA